MELEKFPDSILLICSSLFKTQDDNLTGVRTVTRKALHVLNGQRQVPIQEAVHILDNQELVICSDRITYVSLAQGHALQSETDRSKEKDLITVYWNQKEEHYPLSLEQYFYCVFVDSTFKKHGENKKTDSNRNNNHQSKQKMEEPQKRKIHGTKIIRSKQLLNLNPSGPTDYN